VPPAAAAAAAAARLASSGGGGGGGVGGGDEGGVSLERVSREMHAWHDSITRAADAAAAASQVAAAALEPGDRGARGTATGGALQAVQLSSRLQHTAETLGLPQGSTPALDHIARKMAELSQ
jgi:hypothetical protein